MKRCPECRRDYYDDSLLYCLDDGSAPLKGEADGRDVAVVYAGLGDNDKVFALLEKDLQSRNSSLGELRNEIPFMPLRSDPRFKDLLKRVGLPE